MNKERLLAVRDAILAAPKESKSHFSPRFSMTTWVQVEECGTAACIAGFAICMFEPDHWRAILAGTPGSMAFHHARQALGLSTEVASRLFWPTGCSLVTPQMAAKAIDKVLAGEELYYDWPYQMEVEAPT